MPFLLSPLFLSSSSSSSSPPSPASQRPDGDIIDCVHRHKQPAIDHPLLKNHRIQRVPPRRPRPKSDGGPGNYTGGGIGPRGAWQTWHHVGHCPKGTVPIRRSSVDDVLRARSLYHFGKKQRRLPLARDVDAPDVVSGNGHEHAIAYTAAAGEVYGAKATINVWDPTIEGPNEFSLSQIWILSGSFDGSDLNSIEAGWQVSPELYGDSRPRLFTYWTSDAYQVTGCYNLLCSGFVQTNNRIAIGAAISPVSSYSGDQFDITILIWKDPKLGNWWLGFGITRWWVGRRGGEHAAQRCAHGDEDGSGHFAEDGFGRASYFRNLEVVDGDNSLTAADSIATLAEDTHCYNIRSSTSSEWGVHFYFGGPGNNPKCP
ncbi:unnamed protein product [Spirodela intermedia]|uniref:Neprosin PEP catalytic domain-containing protein n=1 Tax=Spirodela intermedia TaxID=51605 RepID=A0A7I8ICI5_SPIIN|nr:unnamed protein product [Spirodela intermedia]CAA6655359.1 unnamed protein product [Spirodela intermedia]